MKKYLLFITLVAISFLSQFRLSAQGWQWAKGSICPSSIIESWPVTYDRAGNIYESGQVSSLSLMADSIKCYFGNDTVKNPHNMVIVSTDSNGNYRWALGAGNGIGFVYNMVTDTNNNLYVFGAYELSFGADSFSLGTYTVTSSVYMGTQYIAKINSAGNVLWLKNLSSDESGEGFGGIDAEGNLYVAGQFSGATMHIGPFTLTNHGTSFSSFDLFVAKLDTGGNPIWAKCFGGDSTETTVGVSVSPNGEMVVGGTYKSLSIDAGPDTLTFPAGGSNANLFLTKFDTWGNILWARQMHPEGLCQFGSFILDAWGNTYMTGGYMQNLVFGADSLINQPHMEIFLVKYDSTGILKWTKTLNNDFYVWGWGIAPDTCGNVWVAGGEPTSSSGDPMFIFRFDINGNLRDSLFLASGGDDQVWVSADNKGNLFLAGDYMINNFVIGNDTLSLTAGTNETLMLAKYTYPMCATTAFLETNQPIKKEEKITLFPNPSADEVTVSTNSNGVMITKMELFDITGQCVLHLIPEATETTFSVSRLKPGLYTCKVFTGNNEVNISKLVVVR